MVGEGPGQQPALQTRKVIRSSHTSSPPPHTHTLTPTHSFHKQRRPARPRQREMAVQALGEPRPLARGCKRRGERGRAGQGGTESHPAAQGSDD